MPKLNKDGVEMIQLPRAPKHWHVVATYAAKHIRRKPLIKYIIETVQRDAAYKKADAILNGTGKQVYDSSKEDRTQ